MKVRIFFHILYSFPFVTIYSVRNKKGKERFVVDGQEMIIVRVRERQAQSNGGTGSIQKKQDATTMKGVRGGGDPQCITATK